MGVFGITTLTFANKRGEVVLSKEPSFACLLGWITGWGRWRGVNVQCQGEFVANSGVWEIDAWDIELLVIHSLDTESDFSS